MDATKSVPIRNCIVLFIPIITDVTVGKISDELRRVFTERGLTTRLLYYPLPETPPSSYSNNPDYGIVVRIPKTKLELRFVENRKTASGILRGDINVLTIPVMLSQAELYPPEILASFFEDHWLRRLSI